MTHKKASSKIKRCIVDKFKRNGLLAIVVSSVENRHLTIFPKVQVSKHMEYPKEFSKFGLPAC